MKKLSILSLLLASVAIQPLCVTTTYPMDPEGEENPFVSIEENDQDDEEDALNTTLTFLLGTQASQLEGETKETAITAILESQKSFSQLIEYAQQNTALAEKPLNDKLSQLKYNLVTLFTDAKPELPQLPKNTDTTVTDEQLDYLILQLATGTKLSKETRDFIAYNNEIILKRLEAPENNPTQKAPLLEFFDKTKSRALIINNKIIQDGIFWTFKDFSKEPKFLINPQTQEYEVSGVTVAGTKSIQQIIATTKNLLQCSPSPANMILCLKKLEPYQVGDKERSIRAVWESWAWLHQEEINEFAQTKLLPKKNNGLISYNVQNSYDSLVIPTAKLIMLLKEYTNYQDQEDNDDKEESTETKSLVTRALEHPYITIGGALLGITACYGIYRYFTKTSSAKQLLQSNGLKATTKQVVPTQPHTSSVKK